MNIINIFLYKSVLFFHLLGVAMIVGSWFANIKKQQIVRGQLHASFMMLLTGFIFILMTSLGLVANEINHTKIGFKFLITFLIAGLTFFGLYKNNSEKISKLFANTVGILGVTNIAIAIFWH